MPAALEPPAIKPKEKKKPGQEDNRWLVFVYAPASLFSLKASWATSTAGKTLLTPTPYAVKMAFLDAALRNKIIADPNTFVTALAKATVRIGLPDHACVTTTIQRIRQEVREIDRKEHPELPPYRPNVAFREVVHYQGDIRFAFDRTTCAPATVAALIQIAPLINYIGRRGSFLQYLDCIQQSALDAAFTSPAEDGANSATWGHRAHLDDFGPKASFDALSSFTATPIKRGVHRLFVETFVPVGVRNHGSGFVHYSVARSDTL